MTEREIITIEQALIACAEAGLETLAVAGSSAIVFERSFDGSNGTPIFYLSQVTPGTIAYKLNHDERYPSDAGNHPFNMSGPVHAIVFKQWDENGRYSTDGQWVAQVQADRHMKVGSDRNRSLAQLADELTLAQAIVAFAAAEQDKLAAHDGQLSTEQKAHLYDLAQARKAAERERRTAEGVAELRRIVQAAGGTY